MKLSSGLWMFTYKEGKIGILKVTGDKTIWVIHDNPYRIGKERENSGWAQTGWTKLSVKHYYEIY